MTALFSARSDIMDLFSAEKVHDVAPGAAGDVPRREETA